MHQEYTSLLLSIVVINVISASFFLYDKLAAIKNKSRIPEKFLHALELVGGIFSIILLMYVVRHKNRKWMYFCFSWLILVLWFSIIYVVIKYQII